MTWVNFDISQNRCLRIGYNDFGVLFDITGPGHANSCVDLPPEQAYAIAQAIVAAASEHELLRVR